VRNAQRLIFIRQTKKSIFYGSARDKKRMVGRSQIAIANLGALPPFRTCP
jgi:hypothetical protein